MDNSQADLMLKSQSLTNKQKQWLISLSGYLSMQNGYSLDCLLHKSKTYPLQAIVNGNIKVLKNGYDIYSKVDLVETLDVFTNTARSGQFMNCLVQSVRHDLYIERFFLNQDEDKNNNEYVVREWAEKHNIALSSCGIKGFDIGRSSFLCRCAFTTGLITEQEAWYYLLVLGKIAQQLFIDWQEFGMSHLVGRLTWVGINLAEPADTKRYPNGFDIKQKIQLDVEELTSILADDEHPWCQLDWQIDL